MPIPDFQSIMLPLLQFAGDGKLHTMQEARHHLAAHFRLTGDELAERLPSGRALTFLNRVAWAKTYLRQAGLIDAPQRAAFVLSARGREVLRDPPSRIDIHYLEKFSDYAQLRSRRRKTRGETEETEHVGDPATPEERLEGAYSQLRDDLAEVLLTEVKKCSPTFFEKLVVDLLLRMGYGGSLQEAGQAVGRGGDEGIDGVIKEDRLGLDVIYLQAKRWEGTVGRPEIQKFVGALHGKRARKGVFITTGSFSSDAREYVCNIEPKVVLIDGGQLADLMIDTGLGVTAVETYELKRIDSDYFTEG